MYTLLTGRVYFAHRSSVYTPRIGGTCIHHSQVVRDYFRHPLRNIGVAGADGLQGSKHEVCGNLVATSHGHPYHNRLLLCDIVGMSLEKPRDSLVLSDDVDGRKSTLSELYPLVNRV